MTKAARILNEYHIKELMLKGNPQYENFYKEELIEFCKISKHEIDRLNNIINELDDEIYSLYEDICNSDDTYSYRIPIEIIIDRLVKMTSKIAKFKENEELKDSD